MDPEGKRFGWGHRELGGAVDLINRYRLWPHHDFFCKKSLPLSISETRYLSNLVGDTEIRKGEGMELDQLCRGTSSMREKISYLHPFDLDILGKAFYMRETKAVKLPSAEKGTPTAVAKPKHQSHDKGRKLKKNKNKDKKDEDNKRPTLQGENNSIDIDKKRNRNCDSGPWQLKNQQDKKRRHG
ncbi:Mediator of RNA polymerase II transcription subunit 19a like [Quillaja saponaria]|uniref:Mediator of RNA polymerase II transcription subunit 19a like n=1 Tax=Quillaja saponaria TaxID=32244 RepID=A0AAD7PUU2_QUISA|nr:Mediator of RNA polymerase II transcription subunit 19a like [Quillaja saponaria]